MGLFLDLFNRKYLNSKFFFKKFHFEIINYLTSRQVAGKNDKEIAKSKKLAFKSLNYINKFKSKKNRNDINKFLFLDNSASNWGINDNYKSVNSKSYAQLIFDLNLLNVFELDKSLKFDLFGIFHSLDHVDNPKELLNFALSSSNYVIIYCHNQSNIVTKQHHFSFTKKFFDNLSKQKIYTLDLTHNINKVYKTPELYILCSRSKKKIDIFKKKLKIKKFI
jgi:hypothetical protein